SPAKQKSYPSSSASWPALADVAARRRRLRGCESARTRLAGYRSPRSGADSRSGTCRRQPSPAARKPAQGLHILLKVFSRIIQISLLVLQEFIGLHPPLAAEHPLDFGGRQNTRPVGFCGEQLHRPTREVCPSDPE